MRKGKCRLWAQAMEFSGPGSCLQTLCRLLVELLRHGGWPSLFAKTLYDNSAWHPGLHQGDHVANPDFPGRLDVVPLHLHAPVVDLIGCQ